MPPAGLLAVLLAAAGTLSAGEYLTLDGVDDFVLLLEPPHTLGTVAWTFEAWVRPRSGGILFAARGDSISDILQLRVDPGAASGTVALTLFAIDIAFESPSLRLATPVHIAVVVRGLPPGEVAVAFVLNGMTEHAAVVDDNGTGFLRFAPADLPWTVGGNRWTLFGEVINDLVDCDIEHVRVWDHARSLDEIRVDILGEPVNRAGLLLAPRFATIATNVTDPAAPFLRGIAPGESPVVSSDTLVDPALVASTTVSELRPFGARYRVLEPSNTPPGLIGPMEPLGADSILVSANGADGFVELWKYSLRTNLFTQLPVSGDVRPSARLCEGVVTLDKYFCIAGTSGDAHDGTGTFLDDVFVYDFGLAVWRRFAYPYPVNNLTPMRWGDEVLLLMGQHPVGAPDAPFDLGEFVDPPINNTVVILDALNENVRAVDAPVTGSQPPLLGVAHVLERGTRALTFGGFRVVLPSGALEFPPEHVDHLYEFNMLTHEWTLVEQGADLPNPSLAAHFVRLGRHLVMHSGFQTEIVDLASDVRLLQAASAFDLVTQTWEVAPEALDPAEADLSAMTSETADSVMLGDRIVFWDKGTSTVATDPALNRFVVADLASCPESCDRGGTCILGYCLCHNGFAPPGTCEIDFCPDNCNEHLELGVCDLAAQQCDCRSGTVGPSCAAPAEGSGSGTEVYIYIVTVLACVVACVGALAWRHQKRKSRRVQTELHQRLASIIPFKELDIGRELGAGSFGVVYKARWRDSDVAVKMLIADDVIESAAQAQLQQEMAVLVELRHPALVLYMAACVNPPALVLEYMARGTLYEHLENPDVKLAIPIRRRICRDVASGMAFLHGRSMLHRDLKTLNVLLNESLSAKISDFGTAALASSDHGGEVVGTVMYLSPGALQGRPGERGDDVYAYGVLLFEVGARASLYPGMSPQQVARAVVRTKMRPDTCEIVQYREAAVDEEVLLPLARRCWVEDASKRPSFRDILAQFDSGDAIDIGSTQDSTTVLSQLSSDRSVDAPSGQVSFLACDIASCNLLWSSFPLEMARALETYASLIRRAARETQAYVVRLEGDFALLAFADPVRALRFFMIAKDAMASSPEDWPEQLRESATGVHLRVGIHSWCPIVRRDPVTEELQYLGPEATLANALVALAESDQALMTKDAAAQVRATIARGEVEGVVVTELGEQTVDSAKVEVWSAKTGSVCEPPALPAMPSAEAAQRRPSLTPIRGPAWVVKAAELEILDKLATGSYGTDYAGRLRGDDVMVRRVGKSRLANAVFVDFVSQVNLHRRLKHRNILPVIGACIESPMLALVLRRCNAGTLGQALADKKLNLSDAQLLEIAVGIGNGLAALHANGIRHGSLDADCVHLDRQPDGAIVPLVSNFGMEALKESHKTMSRSGREKFVSTAPEVLMGGQPTEAADVYSFGVLLYVLVTGAPPFADRPWSEIARNLGCDLVAEIDSARYGLGPERSRMIAAVNAAMVHEPTARRNIGGVLRILEDS